MIVMDKTLFISISQRSKRYFSRGMRASGLPSGDKRLARCNRMGHKKIAGPPKVRAVRLSNGMRLERNDLAKARYGAGGRKRTQFAESYSYGI